MKEINKLIGAMICLLIIIVVSLTLGFLIGKSTIDPKTKTIYVKGETSFGSVSTDKLRPEKEERPSNPMLPTKDVIIQYRDTGSTKYLTQYKYQVVDTAAIIDDYIQKRSYDLIAFNNKEQGKLQLFTTVQYNKLIGIDYEFTPIQKQITTYKMKAWQPFASGSYSTLNYVGMGGGVFYHNIGFEYQYQIGLNNNIGNGHLLGVKYKF